MNKVEFETAVSIGENLGVSAGRMNCVHSLTFKFPSQSISSLWASLSKELNMFNDASYPPKT